MAERSKVKYDLEAANVELSFWEKCAFGLGNSGFNIIFGMTGSFLTFFWTDVLMIPAGMAAACLFLNKVWDAFNDPLIGSMADRKVAQGGTYRKWLWSFIPTLLICLGVYTSFENISLGLQIAWSFGFYFLYTLCDTMFQVPHVAMMSTMSTHYKTRGQLTAFRQIFGNFTMICVQSFFLRVVYHFADGENLRPGYFKASLVFLCCAAPLFLVTIFGVKERVVAKKEEVHEKIRFSETIKSLWGNTPALCVIYCHLCWGIYSGMNQAANMYFWRYVYGDLRYQPTNALYTSAGMLVSGFAVAFLIQKAKNKRNVGLIAWGITAVCQFARFIVPIPSGLMVYNILSFAYNMCGQIGFVTMLSLIPDVTEHTQLRSGLRTGGVVYAYSNFAFKAGQAICVGSFLTVLTALGYVAGETQSHFVQQAIRFSVNIVPGLIMLTGMVAFWKYKITKESHEETLKKLAE